jgi:GTPase SAR1 family protein
MKHTQPAEIKYIFRDAFIDLCNVIIGSFSECGNIARKISESIKDTWSNNIKDAFDDNWFNGIFIALWGISKLGFFLTNLIFCLVFTPLICFLITTFQISILVVFFSIASVYFGIVILSDFLYCTIHSIASHCPACQSKFSLPKYECPSCLIEHDKLRPGVYGILIRKCNCGNKLPTTFFNGREKLSASCPYCNCNIKDGGKRASWCIPIIGGPSSGKTCYINMTMLSLESSASSKYGLDFHYEDNGLDDFKKNSSRLSSCQVPVKTADNRLKYYQFSLTPKGSTKQLISLCDVAGEIFNTSISGNEINKQIGFRYANAFILIIDPLAISNYRNELIKTQSLNDYNGSSQPIDELASTLIEALQKMFSIKPNVLLKSNVAVVFTKMDIPGLDTLIGENAVLKQAINTDIKTIYKTQNDLCEQFLRKYNEDNFVKIISQFKNIQYFTCSSLGHVENGQPFKASNVEEPFFWLLRKASKVIDKNIK